ncbi:hypothetical protein ACI2KG_05095 [Pseudomonas sp. NPDC089407]|uniref:hypothetical protein n=1 Tax=Pseudomonas sp. NPDC089407 TaxID=3364464 RepID=UPI003850AA17
MLIASEFRLLARAAQQSLPSWSRFVAQTEFVWQNPALVLDPAAWQKLWFEMEIVNALALAEWEEEGCPQDWSHRWRERYEQDVRGLVSELTLLIAAETN